MKVDRSAVPTSPVAQIYLDRLGAGVEDLFHHVLAVLHDPAYRESNAGALRMEWPRIPLPGWPDGDEDGGADELAASAARGQQLAALLDSDTPVPGVTEGQPRREIGVIAVPTTTEGGNMADDDFALTAGWGHFGQGEAVMPGQGRVVQRTYTAEERSALGGAVSPRRNDVRHLPERPRLLAQRTRRRLELQARRVPGPQEVAVVPGGEGLGQGTDAWRGAALHRHGAADCGDSPLGVGAMKMPTWIHRCVAFMRPAVRLIGRVLRREGFWWVAAIVAVLVIGSLLSWRFWDDLADDKESLSTTVRNIGLLIGGVVAILLAVWRSIVAERQADTAQQGLLNERYQRGAEMVGSDVLSVRLGGIYALQRLAAEHPQQYHVQIMKLVCAFVRHPTKDANFPEQPEEAERFVLREDVQEAMRIIGTRSDKHRRLAIKVAYYINLHGADLRGGDLRGLNFSSASVDMIGSMSLHQVFSNPNLRTDMSGAKLDGTQFLFTEISGVDFSRNGESPATGLTASRLLGAQWDGANPPSWKGLVDAITGKPLEDEL